MALGSGGDTVPVLACGTDVRVYHENCSCLCFFPAEVDGDKREQKWVSYDEYSSVGCVVSETGCECDIVGPNGPTQQEQLWICVPCLYQPE